MKKIVNTLQLMLYSVLPKARKPPAIEPEGGDIICSPRDIRYGMERLLDGRGELKILFPDCLPIAAPFVLFRLKRQGFSRSVVRASERGLYVEARR